MVIAISRKLILQLAHFLCYTTSFYYCPLFFVHNVIVITALVLLRHSYHFVICLWFLCGDIVFGQLTLLHIYFLLQMLRVESNTDIHGFTEYEEDIAFDDDDPDFDRPVSSVPIPFLFSGELFFVYLNFRLRSAYRNSKTFVWKYRSSNNTFVCFKIACVISRINRSLKIFENERFFPFFVFVVDSRVYYSCTQYYREKRFQIL